MPPSVQALAVELPGRGGRLKETPFRKVEDLVPVLGQLISCYMDRPFAFFGHSMGAVIGFELARYMRRVYDTMPVHLFVSGRRAPTTPEPNPPSYNLPEPEFVEELRTLNGTPKEVLENPELMRLMIPLLRSDFELIQTYSYVSEPPLDCPITAFGGLADEEVERDVIEPWRQETNARFTLRMLPGDHFFLRTSEAAIAHVLAQELGRFAASGQ